MSVDIYEVIGDSAFVRGGVTLTNEELRDAQFQMKIEQRGDEFVAKSAYE